jgi:dolichol kinase
VELTRKLVHIGTGLLTLLFPLLLGNHWWVLLLCSSFMIILLASIKFKLLRSINAIKRKSVGSIAYPVAVYGCFMAFNFFDNQYLYFYLPILILAICDPVAALTGKKWPIGKFKVGTDHKTLMGSSMFFCSALLIILLLSNLFLKKPMTPENILWSILIALLAAATEAFSRKGYDNITIPASVLVGIFVTENLVG